MNTKQIKKEARERFDKEFPGTIVSELTIKGLTSTWQSGEDIKHFLDQLIDTTIKQTLEGVRLKEYKTKKYPKEKYIEFIGSESSGETLRRWGYNEAVNQQNKLAKEIYEK